MRIITIDLTLKEIEILKEGLISLSVRGDQDEEYLKNIFWKISSPSNWKRIVIDEESPDKESA